MSNPSLKEQLQALVPTSPSIERKGREEKNISKINRQKPAVQKQKAQKPAWLEYVHYGVELLKAHYPLCFKDIGEIKPLKVGIKQDLVKHLSTRDDIVISDKSCMIKSLSYYVTTTHYFKTVIEGAARIGLDGNMAGNVSTEEASYSIEQYKAKMQKKSARAQTKNPST